jgi:heme/copper-type cytochrome/quinol oxidase subunit 2
LATTTTLVALTTLAAGFRGLLAVVGHIAAAVLATFSAGFRGLFPVIGEIALISLTALAALIALVTLVLVALAALVALITLAALIALIALVVVHVAISESQGKDCPGASVEGSQALDVPPISTPRLAVADEW